MGGLIGTTYSDVKYNTISNVTVVGSGMATGGIFGKRTGGSFNYNDVQNISVTGSGNGAISAGSAYIGDSEKSNFFTNGSCVGGLAGIDRSATTTYDRFRNINVYGNGDYVGGLIGLKSTQYMNEIDVENVTVYSEGSSYVGGIVGYIATNSNINRVITDAITVKVTKASHVGGYAGYMTGISKASGGFSESLLKATVESDGTNSYIGGVVGYADSVNTLSRDTVETTVKAPNADYVGGVIGYLKQDGIYYMNRNLMVADVTGKNYVSGMIGYTGTFQLVGTDQKYWGVYSDMVAANVKATDTDAVTSYFYTYQENGSDRSDIMTENTGRDSHPYKMRLWDDSSITTGYSEDGSGTTVTAKLQTFYKPSNNNYETLKYWYDEAETGKPKNGNNTYLSLVSTDALKSRRLYATGNSHLEHSVYTDRILEDGTSVIFTDSQTLVASATVWNWYGLNEAMTNTWSSGEGEGAAAEHYLYLPTPLNPLLLHKETASDVNGTSRYVPYYIGTAEKQEDGGNGIWTFHIEGGVNIPGTHGSILSGTSHSAGTLAVLI